jgi:hypothetical protein
VDYILKEKNSILLLIKAKFTQYKKVNSKNSPKLKKSNIRQKLFIKEKCKGDSDMEME